MLQRTSDVPRPNSKDKAQACRADNARPETNRKEKAQAQPSVPQSLQAKDGRNRHGEDPHVGHDVCDVREECKGYLVDTRPFDYSPPYSHGPASSGQDNLHNQDPGRDEDHCTDDELPKERCFEDAVVQREDGQFRGRDG